VKEVYMGIKEEGLYIMGKGVVGYESINENFKGKRRDGGPAYMRIGISKA
jgi:hypothetical protein